MVFFEIAFAVSKTMEFTTELNKSVAVPKEKSAFSKPDLYTKVDITSDALKFVGFC